MTKCVTCRGTGMREETDGRVTTCDACGGSGVPEPGGGYIVALSNSGGELDRRVVATRREVRAAALDILSGWDALDDGDTLTVYRKEDKEG